MKIQDITVICEAQEPTSDVSAREKLNRSLTSRPSDAHKDKSNVIPRKQKHKGKPMDEAPMAVKTGVKLQTLVGSMFQDFMDTNPDQEKLAGILRIMGKSLDIDGERAVIDVLKKHEIDEAKGDVRKVIAGVMALAAAYGMSDEAKDFVDQLQHNIQAAKTAPPSPGKADPTTNNWEAGSDRVMRPTIK